MQHIERSRPQLRSLRLSNLTSTIKYSARQWHNAYYSSCDIVPKATQRTISVFPIQVSPKNAETDGIQQFKLAEFSGQ